MQPSRLAVAAIALGLFASAPAHGWSIKHPVYSYDTSKVTTADVAAYMTMTEAQLRVLITDTGSAAAATNLEAKTAAYNLALLYEKTKDIKYADKAVILLERFAEAIPKWPVYTNDGSQIAVPVTDVKVWTRWSSLGLWGSWHHLDLHDGRELAWAYDIVAGSTAVAARSVKVNKDVAKLIENDLLRYCVEIALHFEQHATPVAGLPAINYSYGNMGGNWLRGVVIFGKIVDPAFLHVALPRLRDFLRVTFFRDGGWSEASASYHRQIVSNLRIAADDLAGYSDPAGYTFAGYSTRFGETYAATNKRFDNLAPWQGLEERWQRAQEAYDPFTFPDGIYMATQDTHFGQKNWEFTPKESRSACLFAQRHCVLGQGKDDKQTQLHLTFTGTDGHEHYDSLNMVLWAEGEELLSDGEYRNFGNRPWNMSTAGHNTVVVDEKDQHGRFTDRRKLGADDAVDGIGFYMYQDYGHGDAYNFGNLQLFNPRRAEVQVIEASGNNAYNTEAATTVTRYQRTLLRVQGSSADRFYVVDVFRVAGGTTHDWMLHGRLQEDYAVSSSLTLTKLPATTAKRHTEFLPTEQTSTADTFHLQFEGASGARVRTTLVGQPGTEVTLGRAPAMRRNGDATFVDVRRLGGDNIFVAVHEPHRGTPEILKVSALATAPKKSGDRVALEIEFTGGRKDIVALTLDDRSPNGSFPAHELSGTAAGTLRFAGRVAHVSVDAQGTPRWMALFEGGSLQASNVDLSAASGDFGYAGVVDDVLRRGKGDAVDAFVTSTVLPTGAPHDLAGQTVLLTLPDGRREGYVISKVDVVGGKTRIQVEGDAGIELRDGGKLIKHVFYPHHGLRGAPLLFSIAGSVFRDSAGNVTTTAPLIGETPDGGVPVDAAVADGPSPSRDTGTDASPGGDGGTAKSNDGGCSCRAGRTWPREGTDLDFALLLLLLIGLRRRPVEPLSVPGARSPRARRWCHQLRRS